ncbi:hypothetical protein ES703_51513 [subsurface metagenome]
MPTFIAGMKADLKKNILSYYTGAVQVRHGEYNKYDYLAPIHLYVKDESAVREKLLQVDGVTHAVGRITAGGKIYIDDNPEDDLPGDKFTAMAMAIDIPAEKSILDPESLLVEGRLPAMGSREVVLGYGLAEKTGLDTGSKFAFMTATATRGVNAMTFEVVGLVNFSIGGMNDAYFLLPFDTMQGFLQMEGGSQEILLMTKDPETAEVQLEALNKLITSDGSLGYLETRLWKDQGEYYAAMSAAGIIYNLIVIFFLALGATVIVNTTMMAIYERYREIGILGAMGMRPNELVRLFFLEALYAGIISAVIGISLGSALILALEQTGMDFSAAMAGTNLEVSSVIYPDLKAVHILLMSIYTVGISALVTLIPCRKAAKIEPVDAINAT